MTEFKQLKSELAKLDEANKAALGHRLLRSESEDAVQGMLQQADDAAFDAICGIMLEGIVHRVDEMEGRMEKLLAKARETDEDKKLFGEMQCARIEQLAADFTAALGVYNELTNESRNIAEGIELECHRRLKRKLEEEERQATLATSCQQVEESEVTHRRVITGDDAHERKVLQREHKDGVAAIQLLLAERREAAFRALLTSHKEEESAASDLVRSVGALSLMQESVRALRKRRQLGCVAALGRLAELVSNHPDQLRSLRTTSDNYRRDFLDPEVVPHGERALFALGYRPVYKDCVSVEEPGARYMQLAEPNAEEDHVAWCEWFGAVKEICEFLSSSR